MPPPRRQVRRSCHRVRYVRHRSSVARTRLLICNELRLSGSQTPALFVEDENEPDIIPRIAGREIRFHTLQEVGVSATGT